MRTLSLNRELYLYKIELIDKKYPNIKVINDLDSVIFDYISSEICGKIDVSKLYYNYKHSEWKIIKELNEFIKWLDTDFLNREIAGANASEEIELAIDYNKISVEGV